MPAADIAAVLDVLGGANAIGAKQVRTLLDLQGVIAKKGLPFSAFVATQTLCALTEDEAREVVGIKRRTFERRKAERMLPRWESERLVHLARVMVMARDVFEDEDKARHWLITESRALGARPIDLVSSTIGFEAVMAELGRIEHGVYA